MTVYEVQDGLADDEALLLYAELPGEGLAMLITPDSVRMQTLDAKAIDAAVEGLALDDPQQPSDAAIAAARKALVEPIRLPKRVRRLAVSPVGTLSYVPFALLLPEREVSYAPSASTLSVLQEQARRRGQGVLALGDPSYDAAATIRVGRRRAKLSPLPGSGKEVEAVGTHKLLGAKATEKNFREALASSARWRSVHFACHGLVDPERPLLSGLAITRADDDDGLLTALEVFRMRIPADLAALSACDSGRGRLIAGEGILGLSRAFMLAGTPRVLCSLWKVDDEATQALMIRFYELWNPKGEGAKGMRAAQALKAAQEHIRSQEKWAHPYYWAAWTLWGLSD